MSKCKHSVLVVREDGRIKPQDRLAMFYEHGEFLECGDCGKKFTLSVDHVMELIEKLLEKWDEESEAVYDNDYPEIGLTLASCADELRAIVGGVDASCV